MAKCAFFLEFLLSFRKNVLYLQTVTNTILQMSNKQTIKGFWEVTRQVLPITPPQQANNLLIFRQIHHMLSSWDHPAAVL